MPLQRLSQRPPPSPQDDPQLEPLDSSNLKNSELTDILGRLQYPSGFEIRLPDPHASRAHISPLYDILESSCGGRFAFPYMPFLVRGASTIPHSSEPNKPFFSLSGYFLVYVIQLLRGDPTSKIFAICHDLKKKHHFYYFSSRVGGPSWFIGKPPSVDRKWKRKYFVVTPTSRE